MKSEQSRRRRHWLKAGFLPHSGLLLVISLAPVFAQDIRGMEVCTAEKQMDRRTACLQANVEFLQQALMKSERDTRDKIAGLARDLADARGEIAALKSAIETLNKELAQIKTKIESGSKKF